MYGFTTDFEIGVKLGKPLTFSTDAQETEDDIEYNSIDELLRYLDETNGSADMDNYTIPDREGVIIEINAYGSRVSDFVQYYEYEPYKAAERKAQ